MGNTSENLVATGIAGFDEILHGGLTSGKTHIISGSPGTGKTTFALQFIAEGIRAKEHCLYIALGGAENDFIDLADAGGIALDPELCIVHGVKISSEILEGPEQKIFHSAESEMAGVMTDMLAEIQRVKPKRLVIDALSDLRFLLDDPVSYRRLVLAMRHELLSEDCTVLITHTVSSSRNEVDLHLETVCHGVIYLEQVVGGYGPIRRRLLVLKLRGRSYRSGWHDFRIVAGGISVFPTLIASEHTQKIQRGLVQSGNPSLDSLFGGGVDRGSAIAIIGSSGTGKTTVANQFVVAAAKNGERAMVYLFEETAQSYRERAAGLGIPVDDYIEQGLVTLNHMDVAELSAGEFTSRIRQDVEEKAAKIIVIDTLGGYSNAMSDQQYLTLQLHELLTYLSYKGVVVLLVIEQHGLIGHSVLDLDLKNVSYLADSILLLRFFEHRGEIRRAISVIKRRRGHHERTIRELTLTAEGIKIGDALLEMQGVLTGVPILEV